MPDIIIIGGGPAGLAAALEVRKAGVKDVLILERDYQLGGILQQCIHNGFGLQVFNEELTGTEYAQRFIDMIQKEGIAYQCDTMVIRVGADRSVTCVSPSRGLEVFHPKAVILAMGCRERPRGALGIPGARCAGILTAGTAQRLINLEGKMPGKRIVILGSGDIGLIMARRLTCSGAKVLAAVEIMPKSAGLTRNVIQCLDDFGIPLLLSHTVTNIIGHDRVEAVVVSKVDDTLQPVPGTEVTYECDTLLLSVGLIPENELTRGAGAEMDCRTGGPVVDDTLQTSVPGVYACGNVLHVHGLVDNVSVEATKAGRCAAEFALAR